MTNKFERDYTQILFDQDKIKNEREIPFQINDLNGENPLNILEKFILMWPPRDIRWNRHCLEETIMEDIATSMQTYITRKDISSNILEVTVGFPCNLDEIELYNLKVKNHNQEWLKNGSPTETFNPITGDKHTIEDQLVDPVYFQSNHDPLPDSVYSKDANGKLSKTRPEIKRRGFVKTVYRLTIEGNLFKLGYITFDYNNEIIYYNELLHQDLNYLVRRSIQEIWGNPESIKGNKYVLKGISMLIQGKKLDQCRRDNKYPAAISAQRNLKSTERIKFAETIEKTTSSLSVHFAYTIPILLGIGVAVAVFMAFICWSEVITGVFYPVKKMTVRMVVASVMLILIFVSRGISRHLERKASVMKVKSKFL